MPAILLVQGKEFVGWKQKVEYESNVLSSNEVTAGGRYSPSTYYAVNASDDLDDHSGEEDLGGDGGRGARKG
jgi:hypothetical protein